MTGLSDLSPYLYDGSGAATVRRRVQARGLLSVYSECSGCEQTHRLDYLGPCRDREGWSTLRCSVCGQTDDYPKSLASIKGVHA